MSEITLQDRANLYNAAFPKYPKLVVDKGWIYGVWNIGNNYKGSGYYGAYPPSFIKRISTLFPDKKKILHLFSGSLPPGDYTRFDLRQDVDADVYGDAEDLSKHFDPNSFDIIYGDPPYSERDSRNYGTSLVSRNRVVSECVKILEPGGFLVWLDQVLPMYRKVEWVRTGEVFVAGDVDPTGLTDEQLEYLGFVGITRSTNHRVRTAFIFQKK